MKSSKVYIENKMKTLIKQDALREMILHAEQTFPNECCGFFYGHENEDREISTIQISPNTKEGDQRRRFQISAVDYMKAERYAMEHNLTLLGIYHSHPNHPAIPSEHDLKQAMPYFSYIIISVQEGVYDHVRSWKLDDEGKFEEELFKTI